MPSGDLNFDVEPPAMNSASAVSTKEGRGYARRAEHHIAPRLFAATAGSPM